MGTKVSKVSIVRRYLAARFPDTTIVEAANSAGTSQIFYVLENTLIRYRAAVTREVLDDLSEAELEEFLAAHRLAERMREAAPNRVTLTKQGVVA